MCGGFAEKQHGVIDIATMFDRPFLGVGKGMFVTLARLPVCSRCMLYVHTSDHKDEG